MADTGYCVSCGELKVFDALRKSPIDLGQSKDLEGRVIVARRNGGNPMYVRFACLHTAHLVVGDWRA